MCDFSLHAVRSRPAKVGDGLTTRMFNAGTTGFCAPEDEGMAVCLLPGTELSFDDQVRRANNWPWNGLIRYKTAIFRQINEARTVHKSRRAGVPQRSTRAADATNGRAAGGTVLQLSAAPESVKPKEELVVTRALEPDLADAEARLDPTINKKSRSSYFVGTSTFSRPHNRTGPDNSHCQIG